MAILCVSRLLVRKIQIGPSGQFGRREGNIFTRCLATDRPTDHLEGVAEFLVHSLTLSSSSSSSSLAVNDKQLAWFRITTFISLNYLWNLCIYVSDESFFFISLCEYVCVCVCVCLNCFVCQCF